MPTHFGAVSVAKSGRVSGAQKDAADEIEQVLIEYQHLLLVLFRGHHRIQDQTIGCRS